MKTEKEKMIAGEMYDPMDKQLVDDRIQTRFLLKAHCVLAQQIITKDEHINIKAKMFDDGYSRLYSFNIDVTGKETAPGLCTLYCSILL